jgi:hypothetical protein
MLEEDTSNHPRRGLGPGNLLPALIGQTFPGFSSRLNHPVAIEVDDIGPTKCVDSELVCPIRSILHRVNAAPWLTRLGRLRRLTDDQCELAPPDAGCENHGGTGPWRVRGW